jgi:hypothetical protein
MASNAPLNVKLRKATDLFPPAHRLPPISGEIVPGPDEGKIRLQDYAFTQGFCLVVASYDKKRQRLIMECSRHKKKTRNTRKLKEEDRIKVATNVAFNDFRYRIKITYMNEKDQWKITVLESEHNHAMASDPFVFFDHRCRDPDHNEAMQLRTGLCSASTKFKEAKRTMQTQELNMDVKTYYNLIRSTGKKNHQE